MNLLKILILTIFLLSSAFGETHIVKLKIKNTDNSDSCSNKPCQVYVEIPAKLYIEKGWLREDLKNLRFNDGNQDLSYWVPPKKDNNYKINKLGIWLLVPNLKPNSTKDIFMIIDDKNDISYCNPRAINPADRKSDRSSYECAAAVFRFYSYNLCDWKFLKTNICTVPNTLFVANFLYDLDTIWPGKGGIFARTGNEFTLTVENLKYYDPAGSYYSELMIYFLSQFPMANPDNIGDFEISPGYRVYIKKASDFWNVSDKKHWTRRHFEIILQKKETLLSNWEDQAKTDWYPYNNTRHVLDIKVSQNRISLWINGKHLKLKPLSGSVDANGDLIRNDPFSGGFFGFNRKGWRKCCGTDVNYILLRNFFKEEPQVEVYGNTDLVVGKGTPDKGENLIELVPDVQRVSTFVGGNTLDKYIFSTFNIARGNQIITDFKLKIRNRGERESTFRIKQELFSENLSDWIVYWCDENGCSFQVPQTISLRPYSSKVYTLKIVPSPSALFNGSLLKVKINVECKEDASFDNAEFNVRINPKLACYWKYKLPMNISWQPDHGYNTLLDYQVLVEVDNINELTKANENGSDIVVTDKMGNIIPFWIKELNRDEGRLKLWTKVPKIEEDTKIYVWWGNQNYKIPKSDIKSVFDLYEDWSSYPLNQPVGCPDGTSQCLGIFKDLDGWLNVATPDDFFNWWIIKELPQGNKILQADIKRNGTFIDVHNELCGYSDYSGKSCDTGPYLFNGDVSWDHYEIYYRMNAGPYCQYSGCDKPWGNPQYNPVFVIDAGNMWGIEFFSNKFIYRPYASGVDYVWQYQTNVKEIIGQAFPKKNSWYWVKVRVFKDRETGEAFLRVKITQNKPDDIDKDSEFKDIGSFTAPPAFSLPYGKIGFGGWDSGFYFDDIRVRKYVEGRNGKEPNCLQGELQILTPRENISLSQPQVTPPLFNGRSAYLLTETKPFSWLGDLKAFYADCYISGECQVGESQEELGTISLFGKLNDNEPLGLGYFLMKANPGKINREKAYDRNWIESGRLVFTHLEGEGFVNFDLSRCSDLKAYLETEGNCNLNDNFDDETEKLIKFTRGFFVSDYPKSIGRSMDKVEGYGDDDGVNEDSEQWKLGDILHSNPLIVGIPNMLYKEKSYWRFVNSHRDRPLVIYFMSNEGMLHAFEVAKYDKEGVVPRYKLLKPPIELWAYVPEAVLPHLKELTSSNHQYTTDGLLRAIDVKDTSGNWRTILVGNGGKGETFIFAIDITNPEKPKFLWEINKRNNPEIIEKLGTAISAPALGKLGNKWVAIFGSGFSKDFIENYTTKKAYLTVVDLLSGQVIKQIKVSDKIGNVLTDITVRRNKEGEIEKIYFGDYYGAVWGVSKERLENISNGASLSQNDMVFKPSDYDNYEEPTSVKRPITARPVIAIDDNGNWWIFVGTGDYDEYDPNYPHQRFYGIRDKGITLTDNSSCTLSSEKCGDFINLTKSTSKNPSNESWLILLGYNDANDITKNRTTSQKDRNERVLKRASVYGGYVFFTTYQPFDDPCGGGISRFYAVKYNTGEMGEKVFSSSVVGGNSDEFITVRSIELSSSGVPSQPMIYTGQAGEKQVVATGLVNTSAGELEKLELNPAIFIKSIDILLWRRVR